MRCDDSNIVWIENWNKIDLDIVRVRATALEVFKQKMEKSE